MPPEFSSCGEAKARSRRSKGTSHLYTASQIFDEETCKYEIMRATKLDLTSKVDELIKALCLYFWKMKSSFTDRSEFGSGLVVPRSCCSYTNGINYSLVK